MKVSKGLFFLKRALNDLVYPNRFGINKNYLKKNSGFPYALNYSTKGMVGAYDMKFDKNDIIMMSHYVDHSSKDTHYYSPVKIAHYALGAYNDYLTNEDDSYLDSFWKHINFLLETSESFNGEDEILIWTTPSTNPKYNIEENYLSAIVQGLIISALCRAYKLKNDQIYIETALKAANILTIPVVEGGIRADSRWGLAFEEYPCKPYSHVVNGFVFCLIGLYDLVHISNRKSINKLFLTGVDTLKNMLNDWVIANWSKYDLCDITKGETVNLATRHYHFLHIDQLKIMYLITDEEIFKNYSLKLKNQIKNPFNSLNVYISKFKKLILQK